MLLILKLQHVESPVEINNFLRVLSENDSDSGELSCSNLDSDEGIRLREKDCEEPVENGYWSFLYALSLRDALYCPRRSMEPHSYGISALVLACPLFYTPFGCSIVLCLRSDFQCLVAKTRLHILLFNGPYGRQGCVLARTVESNQGGRFDGNESVADSFRSGAVNFKTHVHAISRVFFLLRLPEKPPVWKAKSLPG
ncbi:hypothetical protein TNCV_2112921 [Trichonephila clavipes]|nr:hypothetical protein TNCV_2112921 [Trichonephila clavipes]